MKRETGENPVRYLSLYVWDALLPKAKAGHWETEKAVQRSLKKNLKPT